MYLSLFFLQKKRKYRHRDQYDIPTIHRYPQSSTTFIYKRQAKSYIIRLFAYPPKIYISELQNRNDHEFRHEKKGNLNFSSKSFLMSKSIFNSFLYF